MSTSFRVIGWPMKLALIKIQNSWYLDVGPWRARYIPPGDWRPLSEREGRSGPLWERGRLSLLGPR